MPPLTGAFAFVTGSLEVEGGVDAFRSTATEKPAFAGARAFEAEALATPGAGGSSASSVKMANPPLAGALALAVEPLAIRLLLLLVAAGPLTLLDTGRAGGGVASASESR